MGRPRGGGSGNYGLRRRSGSAAVNPMLYNTGVELMMECFEDVLSPSQIEASRKAKEEHRKALKQIEEAKAEAARASAAAAKAEAERQAKAEAERQAAAKAEAEKQAAEVAAAAAAKLARQNNSKSSGATSPDIMIVGESPPRMPGPRPGLGPMPISGPIINTIASRGVLPPHAAGMPQELYRFPGQGQNAAGAHNNQWFFRPLRPSMAPQQNPTLSRPVTAHGAPRQPGTPGGQNMVTIVSGTSGLGIKRALSSQEETSSSAASKRARGRFVTDTSNNNNNNNNGSGGSWVPLDEYYYGKKEGDPTFSEDKAEFRFRCWICTKMLYNNVKAMMHLQGHIDSEKQHNLDLSDLTQCKHCYKQFDTPFEMQTHIEKVHLSNRNVLMCRICEKDHESRGALTAHMRQNHCACEMPYTCQLCHFRSSMYSDVVDHFKKKHDSSNSMLCLYCLRVFHVKFMSQGWGQTQVYYHHLLRHQSRTTNRKCTYCKLSFFNPQDMKNHRKTHHQPNQRGVIGLNQKQNKPDQVMIKVPETGIVSSKQGGPKSLNAPTVSKVLEHRGLHFPSATAHSYCFECRTLMNTGDHYKKYIQCSMCRFATSCSFAYATHMMGFHSGRQEALSRSVPMERAMAAPHYCSCGFSTTFGNKIANHLVFCSKRTSYLTKPEIPPAEKPAQDETDPRHKPDASILDVLGLVKKQVVNNLSMEEDEVRAQPDTKNIPDTDNKAHITSHFEDKEAEDSTASTTKAETTSPKATDADTSVSQHAPDTSNTDVDVTAETSAAEDSLSDQNLLPSRKEEDVQEESETSKEAEPAAACEESVSEEHKQHKPGDFTPEAEDLQAPEREDTTAPEAEDLQAAETEDTAVPGSENVSPEAENIAATEKDLPATEAEEGEDSKPEDLAATEEEPAEKGEASKTEEAVEISDDADVAVPVAADQVSQEAEDHRLPASEDVGQERVDSEETEQSNIAQEEGMEVEEGILDSANTEMSSKAVQEQDSTAPPPEEEESMDTGEALDTEDQAMLAQEDSSQQISQDEDVPGDALPEELDEGLEEEELLGTSKEEEDRLEDAQPSGQDLEASVETEAEPYPVDSGDVPPEDSEALAAPGEEVPTLDEDVETPDFDTEALSEGKEPLPEEGQESVPENSDELTQEGGKEAELEDTLQEHDGGVTSEAQTGAEEEETAVQESSHPEEEADRSVPDDGDNDNAKDDQENSSKETEPEDDSSTHKDEDNVSKETQPEDDDSTNRESKPEETKEQRVPESSPEDKGGDQTSGDASSTSSQPAPEDSADVESSRGAGDADSGAKGTRVDPPRGDNRTGPSWQPTPRPGQPEESETVRKGDTSSKEKREEHRLPPAPASSGYPDKGRHAPGSSQYPPRPYSGSSDRDRQHHSRDYDHRDRSYDRNRGYSDHRDYRRDRDRDHYDRHHPYDRHRDQRYDNQHGRHQQGGYGSQDRYNQNRPGNRGGQNRQGYNDRNNYYRGYY